MKLKLINTLAASMALFGCNDSGFGDSSGGSSSTMAEIKGVLIAPEQSVESNTALLERARTQSRTSGNCAGRVPSGYERIADTDVEFRNASGQAVGSFVQTDACGIFQADDRSGATTLYAEPAGRRPISTDVNLFRRSIGSTDDTIAIVSTISDAAEYEIRSLFRQPDGRLGFTVADTVTGRPVIGLPEGAFTLMHESTPVPLSSVSSAAQSREAASVALVLDASGTMNSTVYTDEESNRLSRWHVARDAAHLFLNEKGPDDEAAVVIFDGKVDMVNDDLLADRFSLLDESDQETTYAYSESGFTTNEEPLRFAVDLYDPFSQIYTNPRFGYNPVPHPDAPNIQIISRYRWAGGTALFQAVYESLESTADRSSPRKAVVTMGDGGNNHGTRTIQEVIDRANNVGIPVYSIALGVSETNRGYEQLEALALKTGGDFVSVDDDGAETELLSAFESIQIGLVYQYLATLQNFDDIQAGDVIELKLDYNDLEATRILTVPSGSS